MENSNELAKLVQRILSGESEAFDELYLKTYKAAFFHAKKVLKNEQDAEDAVAEGYMRAYENRSRLQQPEAVQAWICRIVTNIALNMVRDNRYGDAASLDDEDFFYEPVAPESETPDLVLDKKATEKLIGSMIDALPEVQRTAVMLYYFDEMSVGQIASVMGCSEGTVKSRLNYARKHLQEAVLAEEKRGVKLYSVSPALLLASIRRLIGAETVSSAAYWRVAQALADGCGYVLTESGKAVAASGVRKAAAKAAAGTAKKAAVKGTAKAVGTGAAKAGTHAAAAKGAAAAAVAVKTGVSAKAIAIAAAAVLTVGGVTTGVVVHNHRAEAAPEETAAIVETAERSDAENSSIIENVDAVFSDGEEQADASALPHERQSELEAYRDYVADLSTIGTKEDCRFAVYDVDRDGLPELFICPAQDATEAILGAYSCTYPDDGGQAKIVPYGVLGIGLYQELNGGFCCVDWNGASRAALYYDGYQPAIGNDGNSVFRAMWFMYDSQGRGDLEYSIDLDYYSDRTTVSASRYSWNEKNRMTEEKLPDSFFSESDSDALLAGAVKIIGAGPKFDGQDLSMSYEEFMGLETVPAVEAAPAPAATGQWQDAYREVLGSYPSLIEYGEDSNTYVLYDMDLDGTPELLVRHVLRKDAVDGWLAVYRYSGSVGKAVLLCDGEIGNISHWSLAPYSAGPGVLLHYAHMGAESGTAYLLNNGTLVSEELFFRDAREVDYLELDSFAMCSVSDMSGLNWTGNRPDSNGEIIAPYLGQSIAETAQTASADPVEIYRDVARSFTDVERPYNEADNHVILYDLDGDGTAEMLSEYYLAGSSGGAVKLSVYTIRNGSAVLLYERECKFGNGGAWFALCSWDGRTYLASIKYESSLWHSENVELLDPKTLAKEHTVSAYTYPDSHDFNVTLKSCTVDGTERSWDEYNEKIFNAQKLSDGTKFSVYSLSSFIA